MPACGSKKLFFCSSGCNNSARQLHEGIHERQAARTTIIVEFDLDLRLEGEGEIDGELA